MDSSPVRGRPLWLGIIIALPLVLLNSGKSYAFDPATDHTCVAYCDGGGSAPNSGGYTAPPVQSPSPAEIAAQRQRAAALALDKSARAAFARDDMATAAAEFERAARLAPNDSGIQGSRWFTKGILADESGDYGSAVDYYRRALNYYSDKGEILFRLREVQEKLAERAGHWDEAIRKTRDARGDRPEAKAYIKYLEGRKALEERRWADAIRGMAIWEQEEVNAESVLRTSLRDLENRKPRRIVPDPVKFTKAILSNTLENLREIRKYMQIAKDGMEQEEQERQKARAAAQASEANALNSSNPNYPAAPPVYRDVNTPRDYPDLSSYTPAQHHAHADNDTGNLWAQKGDWVQALLSYQKALSEAPDGPFAQVLNDNVAIAIKHLQDQQRATNDTSSPAPVQNVAQPAKQPEQPRNAVDSNCTGWMVQTNGASFRLCTDGRAERYCEQADSKGAISRVNCQ